MRTYVVSGAASGIGAATAARLRSDGHRVITVDLRDADVVADLSSAPDRAGVCDAIRALTDRVHGVVPCAGIAGLTGVDSQLLVSVNYYGAIELVEGLHPLLLAAAQAGEQPAVVLISSNSVTCQPGWPVDLANTLLDGGEDEARSHAAKFEAVQVYPASKAALAWWARREGLSEEWAGSGIRVNAVAPGLIATPMTDRLREDPQLSVFADAYPSAIGRAGTPEEIATTIAFLLSDQASLFVGSVLVADGGTDAMVNPSMSIR